MNSDFYGCVVQVVCKLRGDVLVTCVINEVLPYLELRNEPVFNPVTFSASE